LSESSYFILNTWWLDFNVWYTGSYTQTWLTSWTNYLLKIKSYTTITHNNLESTIKSEQVIFTWRTLNIWDICATDYLPVCALQQVQCIQTPCNPVEKTFTNECEARKVWATISHNWVCWWTAWCDKVDIVIWTWIQTEQTWSACNVWTINSWTWDTSYGSKFKWGNNNKLVSGFNSSIWNWIAWDKWPCESWYHIPTKDEWNIAFSNIWISNITLIEKFNKIQRVLLLPLAWKFDKKFETSTWYYWTSSLVNFNNYKLLMSLSNNWVFTNTINSGSWGFSIRCIKDNYYNVED
jgi:hypothetical protein